MDRHAAAGHPHHRRGEVSYAGLGEDRERQGNGRLVHSRRYGREADAPWADAQRRRGTYGWKEVATEFTAPPEANVADVGTLLHGTGTAWFDNVRWECLEPDRLKAVAQRPERMVLADTRVHGPWYAGASAEGSADAADGYDHRAAVRLMNFSPQALAAKLFTVDTAMIAVRSRGGLAECLVIDQSGKPVRAHCLGDRLLLEADVPARSVRTYHVYWRGDRTCPLHAASAAGKPVANKVVPSQFNLVKNGDFALGEGSPSDWWHDSVPAGSGIALAVEKPDRAAVGRRCLKLHVPAGAPSAWRGWRQRVPVWPGHSYLISAWVKYQDFAESGKFVHIHQLTAGGTVGAMGSVGPTTQGASGWTIIAEEVTVAADTSLLELHLTTNRTGTVWYGGVAVIEVVPAMFGREESRPAGSPAELDVWPVPAVVKVFQEDLRPRATAALGVARPGTSRSRCNWRFAPAATCLGRGVEVIRRGARIMRDSETWTSTSWATCPSTIRRPTILNRRGRRGGALIPSGSATCDGWPGRWPDPLLPNHAFDLAANVTQPVWITVTVPKGVPAGDYTGAVRLVAGGQRLWQQPFTVHVWDFTLPDERHVTAKFDVGPGPGTRWWGKPWDEGVSRDCCLHEQTADVSGHRSTGADAEIRKRQGDGRFCRVRSGRRTLFPRSESLMPGRRTVFMRLAGDFRRGPFSAKSRTPASRPSRTQTGGRLRPSTRKAYQACLKLFWDPSSRRAGEEIRALHLGRAALLAAADYSADESPLPNDPRGRPANPHLQQHVEPRARMGRFARHLGHRPLWLRLGGTDRQVAVGGPPRVVDDRRPDVYRHALLRRSNGCCLTTVSSMASRYTGSGASAGPPTIRTVLDGTSSFTNPIGPASRIGSRYPNGDGFLIYPGHPVGHDGPLSTIRLEQAREGVEDFEYLYLLRQLIEQGRAAGKDVAAAEGALRRADRLVSIPNAGGCYSSRILPDPEEVYRLREQVGRAIERLTTATEPFRWGINGHPVSQEGYFQVPIARQLDLVRELARAGIAPTGAQLPFGAIRLGSMNWWPRQGGGRFTCCRCCLRRTGGAGKLCRSKSERPLLPSRGRWSAATRAGLRIGN